MANWIIEKSFEQGINSVVESTINVSTLGGAKGDTGEKGETGSQGEIGLTGEQGIQGIQGEKGVDGTDGFMTEAEKEEVDTRLYDLELTVDGGEKEATYGDELIVNGGFDSGDNWTLGGGWTIDNNTALSNGDGSNLDQFISGVKGITYQVVYDILNYVSGDVRFRFTGTANENGTLRSENGTFTENITLIENENIFRFQSFGELSIDNISVKEVIAAETIIPITDRLDAIEARLDALESI